MIGYRMPTRVHIASGSRARLPEVATSLSLSRVALVVDPGLQATPWVEEMRKLLESAGLTAQAFDQVEPNPRTATAERIAELIRSEGLEGVVALGGGSVLDAAKAAAMLAANPGEALDYEGPNLYPHRPLPMIALPTTCGTGSEVTWVSVLSHQGERRKISVKGETMFPDQALVDADLIRTLPANLVAWTGLDALTHAIEATTCTVANPVSDALAEKAIALLFEHLESATAGIDQNDVAREAVMRASTVAGLGFGNADVAGVHCLSESIGGLFDVPHGLTNAILLAPVLRYHQPHIVQRLAELDRIVHPQRDARRPADERAESFLAGIEDLVRRLDTPAFSSFQISPTDYPQIADNAVRNGSNSSNPQPMTAESYRTVLSRLS